jgi:YesN/AraC family two-component response regulator
MSKSVLIAEDDRPVLIGLKEILEDSGWDVVTTEDGAAAVEAFRNKPTDVVLTDLLMPRMDGMGLLNEIRALDPDVPVVVLTGFGTIDRCRDALRSGATDFLQKPCEESDLISVLDRAYARREEIHQIESLAEASTHSFSITASADLSNRLALTSKILAVADAAGFRKRRWEIRLAFDEAFTNAVVHGTMSDPEKEIGVAADFQDDRGIITVVDSGPGFDHAKLTGALDDEPGGRGIFLIRSFAAWSERGNVCRMTFFRQKKNRSEES